MPEGSHSPALAIGTAALLPCSIGLYLLGASMSWGVWYITTPISLVGGLFALALLPVSILAFARYWREEPDRKRRLFWALIVVVLLSPVALVALLIVGAQVVQVAGLVSP